MTTILIAVVYGAAVTILAIAAHVGFRQWTLPPAEPQPDPEDMYNSVTQTDADRAGVDQPTDPRGSR